MADENGRLLSVDPQICEIMQREKRELVGVTYDTLTHADDRSRNVMLIVRLAIGDGPVTIRKRYVRPDSTVVWANVRASRLSESGRIVLVGTIELFNLQRLNCSPEDLRQSALNALLNMERRRKELGDSLFSDYAWTILVQIYLAEAEGRIADVADI
ncbi:PAS domain-containing protein [Sphingomonas bacterium]|uniref:PAS domain-containing protein n=1 Tax=Sphingomonas bacterium TaxID=1895847 RepID=UPI001575E647